MSIHIFMPPFSFLVFKAKWHGSDYILAARVGGRERPTCTLCARRADPVSPLESKCGSRSLRFLQVTSTFLTRTFHRSHCSTLPLGAQELTTAEMFAGGMRNAHLCNIRDLEDKILPTWGEVSVFKISK